MRGETVGIIIVKGIETESCKHQGYRGRDAVANQLKVFCKASDHANILPAQMVQFDTECSNVSISLINQPIYRFLQTTRPEVAKRLDHLQEILAVPNKTLGIVPSSTPRHA